MNIFQARPAIDLTRNAFVRELGDIRLHGTWLYHADEDEDEPCLVLVPAARHCTTPCVVALSAAFRYTDPKHMAAVSLEFARAMGFETNTMKSAYKIAGIIHDHLLDLIKMPESPTEAVVGAYAQMTDGHSTRILEIVDHVPTRQI